MFVTRPDIQPLPVRSIHDFGYRNLAVSGCSFTYNTKSHQAHTWPYFLRDAGGFEEVYDTSLPGGGNRHITASLQWALENSDLSPEETLVVVMFSGHDRDDVISQGKVLNDYTYKYFFDQDVATVITGGSSNENAGNSKLDLRILQAFKTPQSRAIENYIMISGLWAWLHYHGYRAVFLNFTDRKTPNRTRDFDIRPHLPKKLQKKYDAMFAPIQDIYTWCLRQDFLSGDDFHPTGQGQQRWTDEVLVPGLKKLNITRVAH